MTVHMNVAGRNLDDLRRTQNLTDALNVSRFIAPQLPASTYVIASYGFVGEGEVRVQAAAGMEALAKRYGLKDDDLGDGFRAWTGTFRGVRLTLAEEA